MPAVHAAEAKGEGRLSLIGLCGFLILTHLPFFWTEHVQEDAYISFRTGFNLADHGELTFNLGENYAATTSLLYGYLIATVRLLAGRLAIPLILGLNALAAFLAIILVGHSFQLRGRWLWAFGLLVGLTSGALVASFNGMETSWYLLFIATLMWCLGHPRDARWLFFSLIVISPLVRPEGLVLAIAAAGLQWLFGDTDIGGASPLTISRPRAGPYFSRSPLPHRCRVRCALRSGSNPPVNRSRPMISRSGQRAQAFFPRL
jgi:hypothetical protein